MSEDVTFDDARGRIASAMRPLSENETVTLEQARGRVLALDLTCPVDVPAHDNSAMDGYALNGNDLRCEGQTVLHAIDATAFAGRPIQVAAGRGQCLRIMTGATLPADLDTVVPIELCSVRGQLVSIEAGAVRLGANRRCRGEDLARGAVALKAGRRLRPADLGLIASLGIDRVLVFRRLRVALLSTGDELSAPGQVLRTGEIYDSNRFSLLGALQSLDVDVIAHRCVPDDAGSVRAALDDIAGVSHVVITSGGVGMGDADHVGALLRERGEVLFGHVAIQPGRPISFGRMRRSDDSPVWLFALPGNPVAALVTFHVLVRDALLKLGGASATQPLRLRARASADIRKRPGRTEFQRGVVSQATDGDLDVRLTGPQGSGILRSLSDANALIVLRHEQGPVAAGDLIEVWMLEQMI